MDLDYMLLANYAEASPGGLLNLVGGGWDTINVTAPLEVPPDTPPPANEAVAVMQGTLAARVMFHPTEMDTDRSIKVVIVDEDGQEVGHLAGGFRAQKAEDVPPSWGQGVNLVFPLNSVLLLKFGLHRISLLVDGNHLGDREFRVLKLY